MLEGNVAGERIEIFEDPSNLASSINNAQTQHNKTYTTPMTERKNERHRRSVTCLVSSLTIDEGTIDVRYYCIDERVKRNYGNYGNYGENISEGQNRSAESIDYYSTWRKVCLRPFAGDKVQELR